jgi:hypothetical protein
MIPFTFHDIVFILAASMTFLGVVAIVSGIVILISRSSGKAVETIANQTARLAQKGLAEEVSGLVGNASSLMDALNQLVKTSAGIGIFLVVIGFLMLVSAFLMVKFL